MKSGTMRMRRREMLALTGLGLVGGLAHFSNSQEPATGGGGPETATDLSSWEGVRALFPLSPEYAHFAGMLLASHPRPVREALEAHRRGLDDNPTLYLLRNNRRLEDEVRRAAADYLGARPQEIALTDSTTMGLGLVYNGVRIRSDQEILTTQHDYYSTRMSLRYKAARSGASLRKLTLFENLDSVTEDGLVEAVLDAVRRQTRVLALTWVHSSTGLKLPIRRISEGLARINARRSEEDRVLLCVDGVHALGVEDFEVEGLGCDFLIAGTHKWLFGPRGTGIIWGHPRAHAAVEPTIPTFTFVRGAGWGGNMTPGGFHSFEHRWALAQAFELHQRIGKARVTQRLHALGRQLKEGLAAMSHVRLHTPMDENLSAAIVCFDVAGMRPRQAVARLLDRGIIASRTPYRPSLVRFSPGLFNTPEEIERALEAVRALG
ncbi:aminotransferase class V-fold PLP-dependent enzyme [Archangium violaceum]|nr:aminotransferase class V-fold PLP-dependent enzyme [Archangium violaceum]